MREMKSSGVDWIGDIPVDWKAIPIKYNYEIIAGATPSSNISEYWDGQINWITPADFKTEDIYVAKGNRRLTKLGYVSCSTTMIPSGNIIFSKRAPIGTVAINAEKVCTNQGCFGLIPKNKNINNKFYYYAISVYPEVFNLFGSGTTFREISAVAFGNIKLPFPNINTQKSITVYLDNKCERIDAIITDIQSEIDTLEKYKRSVITEAVAKGLDENVEMKDSGIKWIKQIPKTWKIIPSKYLFHNSDERKRKNDVQLTASQKYGIISQKDYMRRESAKIVLANQGIENWKHVKPDDFIISLRSFQGGLEMSDITGCITWHYVVLRATKPIYPKFYKWLFKSSQYINALQSTCSFIRDGQDLRFSNFAKVPLFEPPLGEQKRIAEFLEKECSNLDESISLLNKQLETLAAYKKSLIYEYVTGKKEVPSSWQN